MNGSYTGGSLLGFHLLGACRIFDAVYATSAGAINSAHFLSGVGHLKAATYYKALADGRFYTPWRIQMPVDIDFVFDVVLRKEIPLEMDRVANSNTPFKVAVLNCEECAGEMKTVSGTGDLAWNTLKAAVAMPVVYNKKIRLPGGLYVDGGMAIPYPLLEAINDGMTDLVVLLGRNPTQREHSRGLFQYLMWSIFFANGNQKMIAVFDTWLSKIRLLDSMSTGEQSSARQVRMLVIGPTNPTISIATQDRRLLREGTIMMAREVLQIFNCPQGGLDALIRDGTV
jgi:predicted patatin/cPLA2 family phospholipase